MSQPQVVPSAAVSSAPRAARRPKQVLPERVDVAVVGSGLGGLVAAAHLAQSGLSVAVFESHYTAGGCATEFARGPRSARWHFDVGVHYVGDCRPGGSIPRMLSEVGVQVDFAELDPDGFDTLVFPDFRFRIPASIDLYRERLLSQFPSEAKPIDRYVKLLRAITKVGRALEDADGARPPVTVMARIALDALRLAPHQNATIAEVFRSIGVRDPALAAVLLGQSGDYGLPPSKVSALLHLGLAAHYFKGAFYPKGGGQTIADRLVARIEALGGQVHLRAPVERILVEGGRAVGLRLAPRAGGHAREVRADVVLSNADLERTLLELVGAEHLPSAWIERTKRFQMAAALFMTYVGLEGDGAHLGMTSSNVWQFDDTDVEGFYRVTHAVAGPIQVRGCYITSASMKDPENRSHHAPPGHTSLEVMAVVPSDPARWGVSGDARGWGYKHGEAYEAAKKGVEDELLRRLDDVFPGAAERVVYRESATPLTHSRFTGATGGTGYGLAATPAQFMKGRPGYRGPLPGLYFSGASTRAGHGIVGAMLGGRAAGKRILSDRAGARARA